MKALIFNTEEEARLRSHFAAEARGCCVGTSTTEYWYNWKQLEDTTWALLIGDDVYSLSVDEIAQLIDVPLI